MMISRLKINLVILMLLLFGAFSSAWAKGGVRKAKVKPKAAVEKVEPQRNFTYKISVGGFDRFYTVHVPASYDGEKLFPVVVMFHGGGANSNAAQFETGWNAKADKDAFLVVYPDALPPDTGSAADFRRNPQVWNDGSGRFYQGKVKVDDVGFISAMLDDLAKRYKINSRRIYAAGFSNGASMCFRVGAELSRRFAAIAPVAGVCWQKKVKLKRPVPLCYITGTVDPLSQLGANAAATTDSNPSESQNDHKANQTARESLSRWGAALGCPAKPLVTTQEKGWIIETYGPCREDSEMIFVTVDALGHAWPGGKGSSQEKSSGKRTSRLKANDLIWEFFERHEMKAVRR